MGIVFCDTETTGVDRDRHEPWEIALIFRDDDGFDQEFCWLVRPILDGASPEGLRIGRYYERSGFVASGDPTVAVRTVHPTLDSPDDGLVASPWSPDRRQDVAYAAAEIAKLVDGATIVGAVPDFDAEMLRRWLARHGQCWTAHYHLVDVETLAAGSLRMPPPWGFDDLLDRYGLRYDEEDRHTALGDARMVRDLYDAVLKAAGRG